MEHDDAEERTEEATEKRKKDSKEKGQVPRSKDLNATILLVVSSLSLLFCSWFYVPSLIELFSLPYSHITSETITDVNLMKELLYASGIVVAGVLFPLLIVTFIFSSFGAVILGGFAFSANNIAFKFEKLNPVEGLKKIFSIKTLVELGKSILKFFVVSGFSLLMFFIFKDKLYRLNFFDIEPALYYGMWMLGVSFLVITCSMIFISLIDVPYQLYNHNKMLKMTKKELKDEMKESDGNPEIKAKINKLQRELAKRRMMEKVKEADVIITNPDHYAVALMYKENSNQAPVLMAKGIDLLAEKIKEEATKFDIPIIRQPVLARSIYYNTELDCEIPQGLFVAVAKVLAYVYQLDRAKRGKARRPKPLNEIDVPSDLRRDR